MKFNFNKVIDQFLENIGLMRLKKYEEFRVQCEEFAKDYLEGSSGITLGGLPGQLVGGTAYKTLVVIGSYVRILDARAEHGVVVAPWVRGFYASGLLCNSGPKKNLRAFARATNSTDGQSPIPETRITPCDIQGPSHDNK